MYGTHQCDFSILLRSLWAPKFKTYGVVLTLIEQSWLKVSEHIQVSEEGERTWMQPKEDFMELNNDTELTEDKY